MNQVNETIIRKAKEYINCGALTPLQQYFFELTEETEFETDPDWLYIYQKVYLHACLKKQHDIVEWMKPLFSKFDSIQQIAGRQMFSYGNWLENERGKSK